MLTFLRNLFRFSPRSVKAINYVSSEGMARNAGYIFGKQHPEMIPQAKLIAMGITVAKGSKKTRDLNTAVKMVLKLSPVIRPQLESALLFIEATGADVTPLVLAFINGMEESA
jgi:hypothetical protein